MTDLGSLSPAKRALLEQALRRRREAAATSTAIPPREDTGPAPLSFSQQRMWFLQQWEPGSPTFNGARAFRLSGRLDKRALERAFEQVIERHESLRTVVAGDREPVQKVLEQWQFELPLIRLDQPERPERLAELLRELSRKPFDLNADLMLRATLVELGPEHHVLLISGHHIAADAQSDIVMFRELSELYSAFRGGRERRLPALPIQYGDYAAWLRGRLSGPRLDELVSYWCAQLDGAPELLRLPTDHPRPPVQRHIGAHHRFSVERSLGDRLGEVGRTEGVTFFIAMLAAFTTLLYRLSGEPDIVVGSPIANRTSSELEGLIGFFTNTIALRVKLDGNPSFREVLARARKTALGAYAHQELPFEKVVEALGPRRDTSYNPLFQVNFRAQMTSRPALSLAGLRAEPIAVDIGFSRFDLALELELRADELAGFFEYDHDLFEPESVAGFEESLRTLLTQVATDPDTRILALKLPAAGRGRRVGAGSIGRRARP